MVERIAIKKLTASDCTLFEDVYRKIGAGNQKSINLNADVFVEKMFPSLASESVSPDNVIALALNIYGPAAKGFYPIARKIIKNATYKNWRLNGEFIHGPPEEPLRYENVQPGDLAVMIFKGESTPTGMDLILVCQSEPADSGLHASLGGLFAGKSMIVATPSQIAGAAAAASIPQSHPIYIAAADPELESLLEDAAQNGLEGINRLQEDKKRRTISASDLAKAKAKAELAGLQGEGLVNAYLAGKMVAGQIKNYKWQSAENAVAPYDFEVISANDQRTLIDAKSTGGPFENSIHVSLAEIVQAAGDTPYRIYRVFELNEDGGKLCVSEDIGPFAHKLKSLHDDNMPAGVRVDGFSVATSVLSWGPAEIVKMPDEEDSL